MHVLIYTVTLTLATGYLVPPADARAIAKAILRYFESNEKEKFRRRIVQLRGKYSWDCMVKTVEEIGAELKDPYCSHFGR